MAKELLSILLVVSMVFRWAAGESLELPGKAFQQYISSLSTLPEEKKSKTLLALFAAYSATEVRSVGPEPAIMRCLRTYGTLIQSGEGQDAPVLYSHILPLQSVDAATSETIVTAKTANCGGSEITLELAVLPPPGSPEKIQPLIVRNQLKDKQITYPRTGIIKTLSTQEDLDAMLKLWAPPLGSSRETKTDGTPDWREGIPMVMISTSDFDTNYKLLRHPNVNVDILFACINPLEPNRLRMCSHSASLAAAAL